MQMMSSEIEYRNCPDCDNHQIRDCTTADSQPWRWHGGVHGSATTTADMPAKEDKANWVWSNALVASGPEPKTKVKEMQITLSPPLGRESARPYKGRDASIVLPLANNEYCHASTSESELITLSMTTGTSYLYHDPSSERMMTPFEFQTLCHHNSEYYSTMAQARMALPLAMTEEPVYVNAKQYHGILRRRQSRAKAELENRISRSQRKPYLHESRHLHAMRRERGCGGRFVSKKKKKEAAASMDDDDDGEVSNMSLGPESMSNGSSCYQGSPLHLSAFI